MSNVQPIASRLAMRLAASRRILCACFSLCFTCRSASSLGGAGARPVADRPACRRSCASPALPAPRQAARAVETMTCRLRRGTGGVPPAGNAEGRGESTRRFTCSSDRRGPRDAVCSPPASSAVARAIHGERPGEAPEPGRVLLPVDKARFELDQGRLQIEFSGRSGWTPFTTQRVPRRPAIRSFWFRSSRRISQHTIDINARNSQIGVAFTGPDIGKFHSGGRISAVFFDNTNLFADRNGFLLTQSYGELFNDQWRFAAGLQLDVFAPGLPTVLPFTARWSRRSVTTSRAKSGWSVS